MRGPTARFLPLLAAALAFVPSAALAQDESPVMGAWLVHSMTFPDGTEMMQHPGLFIYAATHYSAMFVTGDEARTDLSEEPTDAERLAAWRPFVANSGRYEIAGDQLTTRAFVAKSPNYMHAFPDNATAFTFSVQGDELTLTSASGAVVKLHRVEGTEFPGSQ